MTPVSPQVPAGPSKRPFPARGFRQNFRSNRPPRPLNPPMVPPQIPSAPLATGTSPLNPPRPVPILIPVVP